MRAPRRRRFNAGLAALVAVALVAVAVGVVVAVRTLGGDDCGEVLGDRRVGEDAPLTWSAEAGPDAAATGAIDALEGTEAIGPFRGAIRLSDEAGGTTVFSTARDSIIAIALSNTSDNQVARSFNGVSPDAEFEPWARSFTVDLVTTDAGAGVIHALGRAGDGLEVVSVHGASGDERWCRTVGGSAAVDASTASADRLEGGDLMVGRILADGGGAIVTRLEQDGGGSAWTVESDDLPTPTRLIAGSDMVAFGGRIDAADRPAYADGADGADAPAPIVALDVTDGSEVWRYAPAEENDVQWHPSLIGEAAGVFVVLEQAARRVPVAAATPPRLVGLNGRGEVLWTESLRGNLDVGSEDVLVEEEVLIVAGQRRADGARELTARNVADGSEAWAADLLTGVLRPNRIAISNGWLLLAGLAGVEAVDLETGDVELVLDGVPVPDIAAEPGGLVAVEVRDSILVFDAPA